MSKIENHLSKTETVISLVKNNLMNELTKCENDLVSYEIRESILKLERRERKFNELKEKLSLKFNKKDSEKLKKVYKSVKKMNHQA